MAGRSAAETAKGLARKGRRWGGDRWHSMEGGRKAERLEGALAGILIGIAIGYLLVSVSKKE